MHTYDMLHHGDRVMVAVSGGIDSLVLAGLLYYWRSKAPIDFELLAVHLDMGFGGPGSSQSVARQLERLAIPYLIEQTDFGARALAAEDGKSVCFHCSRQRRSRLFELARREGMSTIAFGHHKDDILETFFLNLCYGGNISTMVPRQDLFDGGLAIIRPLAHLEKSDIVRLAEDVGIQPVKNPCEEDDRSRRQTVRDILRDMYRLHPALKANIFAALSNVRQGYLLQSGADS
jgi:tRNA 2-thiocytidine biosynthesis protein TtcA